METHWTIILGISGSATILYLLYFIYLLRDHPRVIWNMNIPASHYKISFQEKIDVFLLFLCAGFLIYGTYSIAFFLLGWMPDNWGGFDYDAEKWVTTRSSISFTIGIIGGGFFCSTIWQGIKGRLRTDEYWLAIKLRNKIDQTTSKKGLEELKANISTAIEENTLNYLYDEKYAFLRELDKKHLGKETIKEILRDSLEIIDRKVLFGEMATIKGDFQ